MWRDTLLLDQPVQHRSCPVSGIGHEPFWLETKAALCSLDHGLRRADFGLADGPGRLNVNDDAELHIDEIVVRVGEECRSLVSSDPLGRRIGVDLARGSDADLRRNILIYFISEGSRFGADSHRREKLLKLLADEEAKIILSSQHDVSPRSAGANPR